ncbi:MAG: hypothetical protein P8099_10665 [Gemmatimonadota bacterium]|jgi:hypothetical protein
MTESEPDRNRDSKVPPPASTQWSQEPAEEGGERPLPPFFAGAEEPDVTASPVAPAGPAELEEPDLTTPPAVPAGPTELDESGASAAVEGTAAEDESFPFEDMGAPAAEGPADAGFSAEQEPRTAEAGMPALDSEEPEPRDDFPVEAFHLPGTEYGEQPTVAPAVPDHTATRAVELADRLDRLAGALRSRGTAALTDQLAGGDRFDALLTGLLAGFLAAGEE